MLNIDKYIQNWNDILKNNSNLCDIALFKIYIQLEKYFTDTFYWYACGKKNESGTYTPDRKLNFIDDTHLNSVLTSLTPRNHIDYLFTIGQISKHIFNINKDPFGVIFQDINYNDVYIKVKSIRNYVAHESPEAKSKYIKSCLGNNKDKFEEPYKYLQRKNPITDTSNYDYYITRISEMCRILDDPEPYFSNNSRMTNIQ